MKKIFSSLLAFIILSSASAVPVYAQGNEVKVYVSSKNGDDNNDGRYLTSPVATPARAVELERYYRQQNPGKTVHIIFKEGTYYLDDSLKLTSEDSGTEDAPVIFRAYQGERVKFTRGKYVDPARFTLSNNERLSDSVKGKVYEANLSDYEGLLKGSPVDVLCVDGSAQQISRMPNSGVLTFSLNSEGTAYEIPEELNRAITYYAEGDKIPVIAKANEYSWTYLQSMKKVGDTTVVIDNINPVNASVNPYHKNPQIIVYNTLEGIDKPGEYYVDATAKKLYYYPSKALSETQGMYLTFHKTNGAYGDMIEMNGVSNVKFESIDMIGAYGNAFRMTDCHNITIYDSIITGIHDRAVYGNNVTGFAILKSSLFDLNSGAIDITGGDSVKLIPSNNIIKNCSIHDFGKICKTSIFDSRKGIVAPTIGISFNGVGTTLSHNEIYNCPAGAVTFGGNDNIVEYNRVYNTMADVWDAGAIYLGRSWINRGNVIRNNYIYDPYERLNYEEWAHDPGAGIVYYGGTDNQAIYADDMQSGVTITGNIVYNMSRGYLIGGGSDNIFSGNIAIGCRRGMAYDNRGIWWDTKAHYHIDELEDYNGGSMYKALKRLMYSNYDEYLAKQKANTLTDEDKLIPNPDFDKNLWINKYPGFAELLERVDDFDKTIKDAGLTYYTEANKTSVLTQRRNIINSTLGRVYNRTMQDNVYVGEWARRCFRMDEWYNSLSAEEQGNQKWKKNSYPKYLIIGIAHDKDGNAIDDSEPEKNREIKVEDAGITVDDNYEIAITGATVPDAVSKSTAEMGIGVDDYQPAVSESEFDVNSGNRFVTVAAIYNGNGELRKVQTFDECYIYEDQLVNLDIDVPAEADEDWYAVIMMWDGIGRMKPVLKEKVSLYKNQ